MNFCHFGGINHSLLRSFKITVIDVMFDSIVKKNRVLRYYSNVLPKTIQVQILYWVIPNFDVASRWLIKPVEQSDDG